MNPIKSPVSSDLRLYGGLFAAWVIGFAVFALDHLQAGRFFPTGTITVEMECLLEASAIFALLRAPSQKPEYRWFLWFFCFLLPSDVSYLVLHYILRLNTENWWTFMLTTLPYTVCYVLASIGFYKHLRPAIAKAKWMSFAWLPMLLIIPAVFGILTPQLHGHYLQDGWTFDLIEIAFNSAFSIFFFFWATVALMLSLDSAFPFLGLAGIISQLGNWGGITAYLSNKNTFTFSEYEYLWLCGIVTFWYAVAVVAPRTSAVSGALPAEPSIPDSLQDQAVARGKSLVVQERMILIGLISASLILATLLSPRNAWSYRIVFFGIGLGSFIAMVLGDMLSKQIVRYATLFGQVVNPVEKSEDPGPPPDDIPAELWQVYRAAFHEKMVEHRLKETLRKNLAELASQVAHDIRSPLYTLDEALKDAARLPEQQRVMVRGAVTRIHDIANNLLDKHREDAAALNSPNADSSNETGDTLNESQAVFQNETCLLPGVIESIVAEKSIRYQSRANLEIAALMDECSDNLFAEIDPTEFKRVLSNLIDNAVEAIEPDKPGQVIVSLSEKGQRAYVQVSDDGKGIPPDVLTELGKRGVTHGKSKGSGLGVYHAKTCAKAWGGNIEIESGPGKGTAVTLILPKAPAPQWDAVLIDDDKLVRMTWQVAAAEAGKRLRAFAEPASFFEEACSIGRQTPIYIDQRLAGGELGNKVAERVRSLGFTQIYLSTAHRKPSITPHIKGVISKAPPWAKELAAS